jgi:SAM-dependent methyltransferase
MMWLFMEAHRERLFGRPSMRLLDVAPLKYFSEIFTRQAQIDYLSADLNSPLAMVKMDLTSIQYSDQTFDAIYCSHVLEHILDDGKAMAELFRVLKAGGWAILQVPVRNQEGTYEDPSIRTPEARHRAFGQFDHVRWYGRDYKNRLESAGFKVTIDKFVTGLPDRTVRTFGLDRHEDIYFCQRSA